MPNYLPPAPSGAPPPARRSRNYLPPPSGTARPAGGSRNYLPPPADDGPGLGSVLLGGGALAAAVLLRKPKLAASLVGKGFKAANAARMTSMLSGFATPKSVLGNIGAVGTEAIERGTMAPIKEFFSPKTVKDFGRAWKERATVGPLAGEAESSAGHAASRWNPFGRFMGAADTATRGALGRAGLTAQESERAVLQAPLEPRLAKALDNPVAQFLVPFRRTPVNQFMEGFGTYKPLAKLTNMEDLSPKEIRQLVLLAAQTTAGGAHGAATADERYPVSIGLGTALANRYGVPYAVGAMLGRLAAGGESASSGIASQTVPFSEFGTARGVLDPLSAFRPSQTAGVKAWKRVTGR